MVVALAVGLVVHDVELGVWEGTLAGLAGEALFMPAARKSTISGFDGTTDDDGTAATAWMTTSCCLVAA